MYMYLAGKGQYESPVFLPLFLSEGKVQTKALGIPRLPLLPAGVKPAQTHTDTHAHKLFSLWHYLTSVQQGVGLQLTTFLHVCRGLGWMALLIISKQQLSHQKTQFLTNRRESRWALESDSVPLHSKMCFLFFFLVSFVYRTIYVSLTPEACIQFSSAWTLAPMSMFWNIAIILEPLVIQGAT